MTQQKQVQIIERTERANGYVTYNVQSSNGHDTYCLTTRYGKATHCTCPARTACYHMTGCEVQEEKEFTKELTKLFGVKKPRRSAKNEVLVASMQVAEGVKIRKTRNKNALTVSRPSVEVSSVCPEIGVAA